MWRIALTVLMAVSLTQAQATRPAAPAPVEKADAQARPMLEQALKQLEAGNSEAAGLTCSDALRLYGPPASVNSESMVHVALHHVSALANLRTSKFPASKQAIDRAMASRWSNDSLIYNSATIYAALRGSAQTAVNLLDKYFASHPDADESWINLYGLVLEKAAVDSATRAKLEPKFKTLTDAQARLEAKYPGKFRWGSEWMDEEPYKELKTKKDEADKNIAQLTKAVDDAEENLQRAQQQGAASSARRGGGGGRRGGGGGGAPRGGGGAVAARDQLTAAQKALDEADKGPQPKWNVLLEGMQPEVQMTLK